MNKCWIRRITAKQYLWLFQFTFSHAQHTFVFLSHSLSEYSFFTGTIKKKRKEKDKERFSSVLCSFTTPQAVYKWEKISAFGWRQLLLMTLQNYRGKQTSSISHYFLVVYYLLQTEATRHNLEWLGGCSYSLWVWSDCNHAHEAETCPWIPKAAASQSKKNRA